MLGKRGFFPDLPGITLALQRVWVAFCRPSWTSEISSCGCDPLPVFSQLPQPKCDLFHMGTRWCFRSPLGGRQVLLATAFPVFQPTKPHRLQGQWAVELPATSAKSVASSYATFFHVVALRLAAVLQICSLERFGMLQKKRAASLWGTVAGSEGGCFLKRSPSLPVTMPTAKTGCGGSKLENVPTASAASLGKKPVTLEEAAVFTLSDLVVVISCNYVWAAGIM